MRVRPDGRPGRLARRLYRAEWKFISQSGCPLMLDAVLPSEAIRIAGSGAVTTAERRQIVWSSVIGTTVEWYDFLIYGTASALVFNKLFFPTFDPLTGTLAALAAYAVGFVARPVGGGLLGYFGDRIGRQSMLLIPIVVM